MPCTTTLVGLDGPMAPPHPTSAGTEVPAGYLSQFVLSHLSKVVWSTDFRGVTTYVAGPAEKICGFTPAEILAAPGQFWTDRIHEDDRPRMQAELRLLTSTTSPLTCEFRWLRKDGSCIWVRMIAAARSGPGLRRLDGILADISGERMVEEEMRQLQKMDAVGQFTGGIAHDFNNLLAVILAYNTMLLDALPDEDARRAAATGIQETAQRAAVLTGQLLAFGRRRAYDPRVIDFNATVHGTEGMLRRLIGEDVALSIRLADGLDGVLADPGQIEQVVINLALNGRDAMRAGGKLTIETARDEHGNTTLRVSDTGCGMNAATRLRAFEPFFTTKTNAHGTGLGLSTCAGLVKQMGGVISIDSEVDQGTIVTVRLPSEAPRTDLVDVAASADPAHADTGTGTILVVEDDDVLRRLICRTLERAGYRVLAARTGADALAAVCLEPAPVDLVLSDVVLPDLSGRETVNRVQARSSRTRALFMSGHIDHALLQDGALQAGSHFIQKPFVPHTLTRKVREVLNAQ